MYVLYYASMLRCWHLIRILVRTNHPCLGVGCHRNKHPRSTQGAHFQSHAWSANQRVQISQRLLINVPNHFLYFLHA
jgi:hypothetical protein